MITIHQTHRLFAVLTAFLLIIFSFKMRNPLIFVLLVLQVCLGISNILFKLPLSIALAHNAIASLLLIATIASFYKLWIYRTSHTI